MRFEVVAVDDVFPAHAGMSPGRAMRFMGGPCFPRPRGDEPVAVLALGYNGGFSPPTRG